MGSPGRRCVQERRWRTPEDATEWQRFRQSVLSGRRVRYLLSADEVEAALGDEQDDRAQHHLLANATLRVHGGLLGTLKAIAARGYERRRLQRDLAERQVPWNDTVHGRMDILQGWSGSHNQHPRKPLHYILNILVRPMWRPRLQARTIGEPWPPSKSATGWTRTPATKPSAAFSDSPNGSSCWSAP